MNKAWEFFGKFEKPVLRGFSDEARPSLVQNKNS